MQNEIELKLRIDSTDVLRLRRHAAFRRHLSGKPITRRLVSIYYDTPDLQLLKMKISLRVRRMSGRFFQAVKGSGHSLAGLHQRMEWEDIIAHNRPDFTKITEPSLAKIFADQNLRDALQPIFLTDVKRTEWQLTYEDGTAIEVALDLGQLEVGPHSEPISEVELELKKGEASRLFELAALLQQTIPLQIENISKAERGYRHFQPITLSASQAQEVRLPAKSSSSGAFQAIGLECLRQMQANQALVMQADVEATHQMHIAVRRLKVAFKLFKFKKAEICAEVDWLNQLLGNARNWDVLAIETLPQLLPEAPDQEAIQVLLEKKRRASYQTLKIAFESQRYQALLLSLGTELTRTMQKDKRSARTLLQQRLQGIDRKLPWKQVKLDTLSHEQLHRTRIRFKRLRHMLEFFGQSEFGKRPIKSIIRLQKQMGALNDLYVSKQLLASITKNLPANIKKTLTEKINGRSNQLTQIAKLRMQSNWEKLRQKKSGHN
jgi:triphosphatase